MAILAVCLFSKYLRNVVQLYIVGGQPCPSYDVSINTFGIEDGGVHLLLTGRRGWDANERLLHTSHFMFSLLSVSNVRNYLNVWSGCVTFLPPKLNVA
jgi:hypothetical protein